MQCEGSEEKRNTQQSDEHNQTEMKQIKKLEQEIRRKKMRIGTS